MDREASLEDLFCCQGQRRAEGVARLHSQRGRGAGAGRQPVKLFLRKPGEWQGSQASKVLANSLCNVCCALIQEQIRGHLHSMTAPRRKHSPMFIQSVQKQLPTQVFSFRVHVLRKSIATHVQSNVRVLPTDLKYPTVASMVQVRAVLRTWFALFRYASPSLQDMEARRDIAENLVDFCGCSL